MLVHADQASWNELIAGLPDPHILQTGEWGAVKAQFGWTAHPLVWERSGSTGAAALALERSISLPGFPDLLRMIYVPRGPLLDWGDRDLRQSVLEDLTGFARERGAIFLKIDPEVPIGTGIPDSPDATAHPIGEAVREELRSGGWMFSGEQVQYRNTIVIDLAPDEDDLLMAMKQKTRYNVRLAGRRGVVVEAVGRESLGELYRMYAETALRDGFAIREEGYYRALWAAFLDGGMLEPLIARVEEDAVAGLLLYKFANRSWYLHGMSLDRHREKMPGYRLQWEAILRSKAAGCAQYDLWGAPDRFREEDPMWGVYRFKEGFGGTIVRHIGAWDLPLRPVLYGLYTRALPRIMAVMRRVGRLRTRQVSLLD